MQKRFSRIASFALALTMTASLMAGCTGDDKKVSSSPSPSASPSPTTSATPSPSPSPVDTSGMTPEEILAMGDVIKPIDNITWPLSDKPITLKIMKPFVQSDSDYKEMAIFKDYEKKTNVKIEWNTPSAASYGEKYNIMIASRNLPDIVIQADQANQHGKSGLYIDLTNLIESSMPNLMAAFDTFPDLKKVISTDEKEIFHLPYIYPEPSSNKVMLIREDILKKHNIPMPKTLDEYYNAMKVMKEKEGMYGIGAYEGVLSLISAWGIYPETDSLYFAGEGRMFPYDNKFYYAPITERYKEGITWLNKIYKEGLIDPEFISNDQVAFHAKAMQNKIGMWRGWLSSDMIALNQGARDKGLPESEFFVSESNIIEGPYGDQVHPYGGSVYGGIGMVITSNCKVPEIAAKWGDYWYSEVGRTYVYGIENVTYTNENGKLQWTDWAKKNPGGSTLNEMRGKVTFGRGTWPTMFQPWQLTGSLSDPYVEENRIKYRDPAKCFTASLNGLSFSEEESLVKNQKMADIQTLTSEAMTEFVIGKRSLDKWDDYVKTVKKMGIDDVIAIHQSAHERFIKR